MFKRFKRNILAPLFLLLCITDAPLNAIDEFDRQVDHVLSRVPGVLTKLAAFILPPIASLIRFGTVEQLEQYIKQNKINVNAPIALTTPWQEYILGVSEICPPMCFAIAYNKPKMVALMLKLGGAAAAHKTKKMLEDIDVYDLILSGQKEELWEVLIKYCGIPKFDNSPYFEAIKNNDVSLVKFFLKHKIPANLQESQGSCFTRTISPIECAIEEDNGEIVETLFKDGQARIGNTPIPTETLFTAANSFETLDLLKKYAKLDTISSLRLFKLTLSSKTNSYKKVATLLQYRKDLDPNKKISEEGGDTLLHIAVKQKSKNGIIALLNAGADINAENNRLLRPLDYTSPDSDIHAYLTSLGATKGAGLPGRF